MGGSVFATMKDGNGFAFLANGEKPNRLPLIAQTQRKILTLMDWNFKRENEEVQEIPLSLKVKLIGTYDDFLYGQGMETKIIERNKRLYVESPILEYFKGINDNELVYLKNGSFKITDYPNLLKFDVSNGKLNSAVLIRDHLSTEIQIINKGK